MKNCTKCGANVSDEVEFCPGCGSPVEEATAQQTAPQQNDFVSKVADLNNTADTTADFEQADINGNKLMAVLSYFGLLVLIPIFAAPKSKYARFHANQGLVLAIVEIVWSIISSIVKKILWAILGYNLWSVYSLLTTLLSLVSIVFFVLAVIGIINAATGKAKELPIIGKFRILK